MSILSLFAVPIAYAIDAAPIHPPKSVGIASTSALGIVCIVLKWLFTGAIVFSIILALMAAYEYMRSAGDPGKVKAATNRLIYVAIGIAVAILARSVPVLVGSLLGAGTASTDTSAVCR